MGSSADRIIDLIDGGLQSTTEASYGTDHSPEACARCQHHRPVEDGDLCEGCRAFLLGDNEEDPAIWDLTKPRELPPITLEFNVSTQHFQEMVERWAEQDRIQRRAEFYAHRAVERHESFCEFMTRSTP